MTETTTIYAIVRVGGKQYRVAAGDSIVVDRVAADEGAHIDLVPLAVRDDKGEMHAGKAAHAKVKATVAEHFLGDKIDVFTYKPKSTFKKSRGHRSRLSRLDIDAVEIAGKKEKKSGS
jgi:large subunit ribosomal protein L21